MKRIPFLKINTKNGPTDTKKYFPRLQNESVLKTKTSENTGNERSYFDQMKPSPK